MAIESIKSTAELRLKDAPINRIDTINEIRTIEFPAFVLIKLTKILLNKATPMLETVYVDDKSEMTVTD